MCLVYCTGRCVREKRERRVFASGRQVRSGLYPREKIDLGREELRTECAALQLKETIVEDISKLDDAETAAKLLNNVMQPEKVVRKKGRRGPNRRTQLRLLNAGIEVKHSYSFRDLSSYVLYAIGAA